MLDTDEGVAWPSYVDFLSSFVFILMLFLASTVYVVSGVIHEQRVREQVAGVGAALAKSGIANVVEGRRIRISLRNKVTFGLQKTALDETAQSYLREVGKQMGSVTGVRRIIVEGYADKVEVKNDEFGNWRYSIERAVSVLRFLYLCAECGFDQAAVRSKLVLRGEGDLDATALSAAEQGVGRAEDRRVDIVLDFGSDTAN